MNKNLIKIKSLFACIVIVVVFLSSCEKDNSKPEQQADDTKTCFLKKVTDINGGYEEYFYNDSNRLIKMESNPETMTMTFTYDVDGRMSQMLIIDSEGSKNTTFEYNEKDELVSASTNNGLATFAYEYDNGKLIRVNTFGNIPTIGNTLMVKTEYYYSDNNVSEFREYTLNFMTGNLDLSEKVTYEHDSNKNPFFELGISMAVVNIGYEIYASKNNCNKRTVVLSSYGDPIGSHEIKFEYNKFGYPISAND